MDSSKNPEQQGNAKWNSKNRRVTKSSAATYSKRGYYKSKARFEELRDQSYDLRAENEDLKVENQRLEALWQLTLQAVAMTLSPPGVVHHQLNPLALPPPSQQPPPLTVGVVNHQFNPLMVQVQPPPLLIAGRPYGGTWSQNMQQNSFLPLSDASLSAATPNVSTVASSSMQFAGWPLPPQGALPPSVLNPEGRLFPASHFLPVTPPTATTVPCAVYNNMLPPSACHAHTATTILSSTPSLATAPSSLQPAVTTTTTIVIHKLLLPVQLQHTETAISFCNLGGRT